MNLASRNDVAPGGAFTFQFLVIMLFSKKKLIAAPDTSGFPLPVDQVTSGNPDLELDLQDSLTDGRSIRFF